MTEKLDLLTEIPIELPGKIFRSPMPFSHYDPLGEVWQLYAQNEVRTVVVLNEQQEYLVHARRDLPKFYQAEGLDAIHFPVQDYHAPADMKAMHDLVGNVLERLRNHDRIAVHCMAGVGRTGTLLACLGKQHFGFDGPATIDWIRQYIPNALENNEQEQFVMNF